VPSPEVIEKETKRMKKRFKIIKEIIETEDIFLQDMSVLEDGYSAYCNECPAISTHNKQTIFGRTGSVVEFSKLFYKEIVQSSLDYVNRMEEDVDGASYEDFLEWDKEIAIGEAFWSSVR
jgi:RhoGEF domain